MKIHFPSLVFGAALTTGIVLFAAAQRPPLTEGRFELEASPYHVFVLDRDTGRVWEKYLTDESGHTDQDFGQPKISNR